jgi:hypothetical protein
MKKVEDYRQHAVECRQMANRSRSPEERAMLSNMADTWQSLASDREAQLARQTGLAAIETGPGGANCEDAIPVDQLNASNDEWPRSAQPSKHR